MRRGVITLPMEPQISDRHKCFACHKEFKESKHLVEHMRISYHSPHQPQCMVCHRHFKTFESLREHFRDNRFCEAMFTARGCQLCLEVFLGEASEIDEHEKKCRLLAPVSPGTSTNQENEVNVSKPHEHMKAISIAFHSVEGRVGVRSSDLCASVCMVDEDEKVVFTSHVKPLYDVDNYRHEVTGLTEEDLKDGLLLQEVKDKVKAILADGEGTLLVGHGLRHCLMNLGFQYPTSLVRDTAVYRPLMKTNLVSHSLKYLTKKYMGYDIQCGKEELYEDCVSAMRLYKRMRDQKHKLSGEAEGEENGLESCEPSDVMKMCPEDLYLNSKSDYRCWCLDRVETELA